MFCKNCGTVLSDESVFCNKCGEKSGKETLKGSDVKSEKEVNPYYAVSTLKLVILSVCTLGFYYIYWFSKNWRIVKENEKINISPGWRGFLTIWFCYPLFKKIYESAKNNGYKENHSPGLLATAFILLMILGRGENGVWLLSLLSFIPILIVQKIINFNNTKIDVSYEAESKFFAWEYVFSIIGIAILFLAIIGTISSSTPLEKTLADTSIEMNKTLPEMIDKITQLTSTTSSGKNLVYNYKIIDTSKHYTQNDLNSYLKTSVTNGVCTATETKKLLDLGAGFVYNYYDNVGSYIGNLSVLPGNCK